MGRVIPPSLCARCKGYKRLCGLSSCPILERFRAQVRAVSGVSGRRLEGSSPPSVVVGESGYPKVPLLYSVPPGVSGDRARVFDDPPGWFSRRASLAEILRYRSSLVSGVLRVDARSPEKLYELEVSLAAVSASPVDTEALLEHPPLPALRFDGLLAPQGPSAPARTVKIFSNPRLPRALEKRIWDDARASDIVVEAYRDGASIYSIISALSLGLIGRLKSRRLVPTRWAITAVDNIISTTLLHKVRAFPEINQVEVYHGSYLGNHYTIILLPGTYSAELIEVWHPLTPWTRHAREPVTYRVIERVSLRQNIMDGGFMAIRLGLAEQLYRRRRQARALIVREITRDYYAPLGNWHIRETIRKILLDKPQVYDSVEEALKQASKFLSTTARGSLTQSILLKEEKSMVKLDKFLKAKKPFLG
ncbi:MAG: hypothetical protein DSY37_00130 [Hyperthermus sp.]|nr:MAG: hypothetical protein DSY37_00130 [Hyperthermus sp.]